MHVLEVFLCAREDDYVVGVRVCRQCPGVWVLGIFCCWRLLVVFHWWCLLNVCCCVVSFVCWCGCFGFEGPSFCEFAEDVKECVHYVTLKNGGRGAVREVVDLILKTQAKWPQVTERYFQ